MGCWNETCAITNLPIRAGDPVVLMFLSKVMHSTEQDHAGHCYANSVWTPRALPIYGKYDDYGSLEDIQECYNTHYILDSMQMDIAEYRLVNHKREPKRLENNLDLSNLSMEEILEAVHNDSLWVNGVGGAQPVGWMMMHAWAYNMLSEKQDTWRGQYTQQLMKKFGEEFYQVVCETVARNKSKQYGGVFPSPVRVPDGNPYQALSRDYARLDGYGSVRGITNYMEVLIDLCAQGNSYSDPSVQNVLDELGKFLIFNTNMQLLRKQYAPQSGKGSQEGLNKLHEQFFSRCLDWINTAQEGYDDEWEEDLEDQTA